MQTDNNHNLILTELKSGKYNLTVLEKICNIPLGTLKNCNMGKRNIPQKYIETLTKEMRL
jgi:hypothetical protein